jgi:hypothetical protein
MRRGLEGQLDPRYDDVGALVQRGAEHRVDLIVEDESARESGRFSTPWKRGWSHGHEALVSKEVPA